MHSWRRGHPLRVYACLRFGVWLHSELMSYHFSGEASLSCLIHPFTALVCVLVYFLVLGCKAHEDRSGLERTEVARTCYRLEEIEQGFLTTAP